MYSNILNESIGSDFTFALWDEKFLDRLAEL